MATPLRKTADGYGAYAAPQTDKRRNGKTATARKRLVSRQIRSNSELRRDIAWVTIGMFSVFFLMGISSTSMMAGLSRVNYDINSVRAENEQILLDNDRIRGQIAELRSLERIESIATGELGMVKNESVEYMVLSSVIVAEGKVRALTEESAAEEEYVKPLDKIREFLQTWKKNTR